jgi:predicted lysophospholipase L1 biosynthesis ABC-type transport system permease subunit
VAQLRQLSDEQAKAVLSSVDRANARSHSYAVAGMICGTISFLALIASFTYLVMNGHYTAAGAVFGTGVLAIIGKMIGTRLIEE